MLLQSSLYSSTSCSILSLFVAKRFYLRMNALLLKSCRCVQNVMNVLKLAPENEHQKEKKNADYLCLLRFATSPQLSSVCTMSECSAPNFVYSRRKQQGNSVAVFSAEALVSTKRGGEDCLSVVSSDAPSVAVNELYVACQSEHTNGDHIMPSTVCNREPGVLKSESINRCSLVKELGSDRTSKYSRHNFVYRRKKLNGNSISVFSSEAPCLSVVSSDSPSFAVKERDVASQSKQTNRDPFMPSTVCNREPGVLKSESINGCSLVKELGSDRTSKNSGQNFVYKRKKLHGNSIAVFSAEAPCLSVVSSDSPSFAVREQDVASQSKQTNRDPFMPSTVCKGGHCIFKSESINGCFPPQEHGFNEASKSMSQKIIEVDSINDSCSSSKSDTELGLASSQTEVDNSGECSSSSVIAAEVLEEDMSEKDLCVSEEGVSDSSASSSYQLCKICSHPESTLKMLICDNCEEAFHLFCCNPRVKRIPLDDWFCHSCSKKRHKILKETISRSRYMIGEKGRCGSSSRGETNPIVLMLRDTGPYRTGVRCGKGFQAEVPEWSGPITNGIDIDTMAEPLEMSPSYFVSSTELNSNKSSKLSSIGNWLQCRVVVDSAGESANGTICGKWRRAPLFEVQTDDWECFCSVLWDPVHADCAVPQELDTDQVLLQLKYIQMLRPQLEAKRQKLEHRKNDDKSMDVVNWQQWKSWQQLQVNDDDSVDVVNQEQLNSQQQYHANDDNSMNVVYQQQQQQQQNGTIMYRRYTHGCKKGSYQD